MLKPCPFCSEDIQESATKCRFCNEWLDGRQPESALEDPAPAPTDDLALRMVLPVGRTVLSIVAGYLGLLSVLCVPAPFALIVGLLAIREIRQDDSKRGMGRAVYGVVMGLVFTVVLLVTVIAGVLGP